MDIIKLTVDEKFDHDMPAESMSILLMNCGPMLTFNFSVISCLHVKESDDC